MGYMEVSAEPGRIQQVTKQMNQVWGIVGVGMLEAPKADWSAGTVVTQTYWGCGQLTGFLGGGGGGVGGGWGGVGGGGGGCSSGGE